MCLLWTLPFFILCTLIFRLDSPFGMARMTLSSCNWLLVDNALDGGCVANVYSNACVLQSVSTLVLNSCAFIGIDVSIARVASPIWPGIRFSCSSSTLVFHAWTVVNIPAFIFLSKKISIGFQTQFNAPFAQLYMRWSEADSAINIAW